MRVRVCVPAHHCLLPLNEDVGLLSDELFWDAARIFAVVGCLFLP